MEIVQNRIYKNFRIPDCGDTKLWQWYSGHIFMRNYVACIQLSKIKKYSNSYARNEAEVNCLSLLSL